VRICQGTSFHSIAAWNTSLNWRKTIEEPSHLRMWKRYTGIGRSCINNWGPSGWFIVDADCALVPLYPTDVAVLPTFWRHILSPTSGWKWVVWVCMFVYT
jgi:hypothetical protein